MADHQKRLCILMPAFLEQITGGAEYQAYLLADEAKKNDIEVHYIFVSEFKLYPNHLNLQLHTIKPVRFTKRLGATWNLYFPTAYRLLKKIKPDAIYTRGGWSFAGLAAYYAKHNECKSIWHVAHAKNVIHQSLKKQWRRPFDIMECWSVNYAIKHSHHVVAQAPYQAGLLLKNYGRESVTIFNGQPEPSEYLNKDGPFTVVWVANIKIWKQPEMFIRLAKEFQRDDRLLFIMIGRPGGDEYQRKLENSMVGITNLDYRRGLSIEEVNIILSKAHVFVNTSTCEGSPNTFVQAWMREVPVVSLSWDPDDIIVKQKIGFFSGSIEQMTQDIRTLVDNPKLRETMGTRARAYALEHHSIEKNMKRLLKLIVE